MEYIIYYLFALFNYCLLRLYYCQHLVKSTVESKMEQELILLPILVATCAFISGSTGLLGGSILLACLLALFPLTQAMIIHGCLQCALNCFRAYLFRRHVCFGKLFYFLAGAVPTFLILVQFTITPETWMVYVMLGSAGLVGALMKNLPGIGFKTPKQSAAAGAVVTGTVLTAGVGGPILDAFFVQAGLSRFQIMGTKSVAQGIAHFVKASYFLSLASEADLAAVPWSYIPVLLLISYTATKLGKFVVEKMTECSFDKMNRALVSLTSVSFLLRGILM